MDLNWENVNDIGLENFKNFIKKYLQKNALFCTSNHGDGNGESLERSGLIKGHAYSLLSIEEVNGTTLVRIRNPHGRTEWKGQWSDHDPRWNSVSQQVKNSIGYSKNEDGGFFMSFEQWIQQYEAFTTCYMPWSVDDSPSDIDDRDTRVMGTLVPGKNSGPEILSHNLQFVLTVPHEQDVWIQLLQDTDSPKEDTRLMFNMYSSTVTPTRRFNFLQYPPRTLAYVPPM